MADFQSLLGDIRVLIQMELKDNDTRFKSIGT